MNAIFIRAIGIAAASFALFCLGGCGRMTETYEDMASEKAAQMSLVLPAGKALMVDGQRVLAFGSDVCPQGHDGLEGVIGSPSDAGDRNCIVIDPKTESVRVRMLKTDGQRQLTDSIWTVKRSGNHGHAIHLLSAKGTPVYDAEKISGT